MTEQQPSAEAADFEVSDKVPTKPGYYWAKWRIPSDGTHEGSEMCPSDRWEIVQVNANSVDWERDPLEDEALSVSVPGVRETQWRDCFVWGDFVSPLSPDQRALAAEAAAEKNEMMNRGLKILVETKEEENESLRQNLARLERERDGLQKQLAATEERLQIVLDAKLQRENEAMRLSQWKPRWNYDAR